MEPRKIWEKEVRKDICYTEAAEISMAKFSEQECVNFYVFIACKDASHRPKPELKRRAKNLYKQYIQAKTNENTKYTIRRQTG